ncbi:uncharacterized protein [Apostichopus japonicus]|uniref:uncharacterized protein isoform X4 n=1 Tax=Stichopus japonicus TaxID=307972 RepID=UPI003AB6399A
MYNGVGLTTARGSGTNGFVQRNFALVRNAHQKMEYKSEEEIKKTEAALSRPPNQEILAHERKRQVEIKCFEMQEHLEEQGHTEEEITRKVSAFRKMLMDKEGVTDTDDDSTTKSKVSETHQLAAAKEKQNQKLREAFGISDTYVDGSSFDPDRKAKEAEAKAMQQKKYSILLEPADPSSTEKKKRKKHDGSRSESESPERKHKKKKKKSHKKHKRSGRRHRRRHKRSHTEKKKSPKESKDNENPEGVTRDVKKSDNESGVESAGSSPDKTRSSRKKSKKRRKHSHSPYSDKSDNSRSPSPHKDEKKTRRHSRSRSRSQSRSPSHRRHHSRSRSHSRRSRSKSLSYSPADKRRSASRGSPSPRGGRDRKKSFSPIRKRRDSPSFLDRRRITRSRSRDGDRRREDDDTYSRRRRDRSRSRDYHR